MLKRAPTSTAIAALSPDELRLKLKEFLGHSAIAAFLELHEEAGTHNEHVICGLADVRISLGELRTLVRMAKKL